MVSYMTPLPLYEGFIRGFHAKFIGDLDIFVDADTRIKIQVLIGHHEMKILDFVDDTIIFVRHWLSHLNTIDFKIIWKRL